MTRQTRIRIIDEVLQVIEGGGFVNYPYDSVIWVTESLVREGVLEKNDKGGLSIKK